MLPLHMFGMLKHDWTKLEFAWGGILYYFVIREKALKFVNSERCEQRDVEMILAKVAGETGELDGSF